MLDSVLDRFADHEFVVIDGFNDCVVGVVEDVGGLHLLYSLSRMFDMDREVVLSEDYFYFNVMPLSSLEGGPVFLEDLG